MGETLGKSRFPEVVRVGFGFRDSGIRFWFRVRLRGKLLVKGSWRFRLLDLQNLGFRA